MNDTVTRLMALAGSYALQSRFDLENQLNGKPTSLAQHHRQTLQDELQKLFTPLRSCEIGDHIYGLEPDTKEGLCAFSFREGARWAEKEHGIGEQE